MDGIEGLLARDFGVRPQGKVTPMAGASSCSTGSAAWARYGRSAPAPSAAPSYDDLFSGPAPASASAASFDSLFDSFNGPTTKPAAPSPAPAPAYDDIFDAVPGLRSSTSTTTTSSAPRYNDGVFGSSAAPAYDDAVFGSSAAPPLPYRRTGWPGTLNRPCFLGRPGPRNGPAGRAWAEGQARGLPRHGP